MAEENEKATLDSAVVEVGPIDAAKRQRSSIAFPYMDLSEGDALARAIYMNVGTGQCTPEQLAAWIKQSPTSSAFRLRLGAGRMFGLLDTSRGEDIRLSDLGRMLVDDKREREARARAFLAVPLYRSVFDRFKGGVLPPTAALERELVALGVADTLKDRARAVMERSAEQAGFYESGRDRLVMPGFLQPPDETRRPQPDGGGSGGGNGSGNGGGPEYPKHPLIVGLFQSLPPDGSADWKIDDLVEWLEAAAVNLRLVYKLKGTITVCLKDLRSRPTA